MRVGLVTYELSLGTKCGAFLLMFAAGAGVIGGIGFLGEDGSDILTCWILLGAASILAAAGAHLCWGTKAARSGRRTYRGVLWDMATQKGAQGRFVLTLGSFSPGMSWGKAVKQRSLLDVTACNEPRQITFIDERPELVIRLIRRHDRSQYHLGGVSFAGYDVIPMEQTWMDLVVDRTILSVELAGHETQPEFCRRLREMDRVLAGIGSSRIAVRLLVLQPLPPDSSPSDIPSVTVKAGYVAGGLAGAILGSAIDSARTPTEAQVSKDMAERCRQMENLICGDDGNPSFDSLDKIAKDLSWVVEVC